MDGSNILLIFANILKIFFIYLIINQELFSSLLFHFHKYKKEFYYLSLFKHEDNSFSIHGLWPQENQNKYPTYCKKVYFKPIRHPIKI